MNKREIAERLLTYRKFSGDQVVADLEWAAEALQREADAEEKAKPKVTLKDQVDVVASARCEGFEVQLKAAADTLRRLDDEGGELLGWLLTYHGTNGPTTCGLKAVTLLRSLGVEPKP